jgi:hypothetical protein
MSKPSLILWVDQSNNTLLSDWQSLSSASSPTFKQGDTVGVELHILSRNVNSSNVVEEVPFGSATVRMAVGNPDASPSAGTWKLAYGSNNIEFSYAESASAVQTALNALSTIYASGGVSVLKINNHTYRISFNTVGTTLGFTADASPLIPASVVQISQIKVGSATQRAVFQVKLKQQPIAFQSTWASQSVASISSSVIQTNVTRISISPSPKGGTFTLTVNGDSTKALNYNATALEVGLAVNELLEDTTTFEVVKSSSYQWDISNTTSTSYTIGVDNGAGLISFDSKYGVLNFNNYEVENLLNGSPSVSTTLEIEITRDGNITTVYQGRCVINAQLLETTVYEPIPYQQAVTEAPTDGQTYGRKDATWSVITAGGGDYLPLAGGSMTGDIIFPAVGSGSNSQVGTFGFGTENVTLGQVAYIEPNQIRIYDGTNTNGTSLNGVGITFNDSTTQTTAGLPLSGGTMNDGANVELYKSVSDANPTGSPHLTVRSEGTIDGNYRNNFTDIGAGGINLQGDGDNFFQTLITSYEGFKHTSVVGGVIIVNGDTGITFNDSTQQTTAGLPLTGGTMSGAIRFDEVGTQNISKGSFDGGYGAYNGISLTCANDVELNWQAGYLKAKYNGSFVPINVDGDLVVIRNFPADPEQSLPPYSSFTTIKGDGINSSYAIAGNWTGGWGINQDGVSGGGGNTGASSWFGGVSGAGGDDDSDDWSITPTSVNGFIDTDDKTYNLNSETVSGSILDVGSWEFGINGAKFLDGTIQTTAGLPLHATTNSIITSAGSGSGDTIFKNYVAIHNYLDIQKGVDPSVDGKLLLTHFGEEEILSRMEMDSYGITFPDGSNQSVACPPAGGTTADYIDGTGALQVFPEVGDRYLTSSTSTLTCDSGNGKTMTVGTGLSYSRQQDITVSYNTANHMHGTVLTYNSATGVMTFDSNTHSGGGTYSSWVVNVGGVAGAVLPVSGTAGQVLAKIDSNNFNTEWVSLGNVALNNYATTAQAQAGTSTTTVVNPSVLDFWENWSNTYDFSTVQGGQANTSGTGATATISQTNKNMSAPTSAVGYAQYSWSIMQAVSGVIWNNGFNWNKKYCADFNISTGGSTDTTNSAGWVVIGETGSVANFGSPNGHSVGVKLVGLNLYGFCHNGTTLNLSASPIKTMTANLSYTIRINTDGAGNASFYVDDVFATTMNNCPTGQAGFYRNAVAIKCVNTAILSGTPVTILMNKIKLRIK